MNGIIAWFAQNRVAANLLMVFIIIAGIISLGQTRKEIVPGVSLDLITITAAYPGASPEDVEKSVVNRIESAIYDLEGVKSVASNANEHVGVVSVEVAYGYNAKDLLNEIKARVDAIGSFPKDVERPIIKEISVRNLVSYIIISGPADERSLKRIAEQVKSDLTAIKTISQVEHSASKPYEIAIEVSEGSLQRYGLSFAEVAGAIRKSSMDLPTGVIKTVQGNVSIEAKGQAYWGDQFEDIVVRALPDGAQVLVGDVARVTDGFREGVVLTKFNGKPAVALSVFRVGDQNILEISEALQEYVKNPTSYIPENVDVDVWQDTSVYFKSRIDLLTENAAGGLALLFCVLLLFLRAQLSFWVSVGIPISFMGAFWLLPYFGGSINMVSLFAFILVLGVVVDDAIIVGENIFSHHRRGILGIEGAIKGAQEVSSPVIFAVLTTVLAFMPLIFLPGPEGKLMKVIPIVVIATLMFSLLESLLVLPAHLSGIKSGDVDNVPGLRFAQAKFSFGLERFIQKVYRPFLELTLRWRYSAIFGFLGALLVVLTLVAAGWLKIVFFSPIEADTASADVSFSQNAAPEVVRSGITRLEEVAFELKDELKLNTGQDQILHVFTTYATENSGNVIIEMAPSENREISGSYIADEWRKRAGDLPEMIDLKFKSTLNQPSPAIDIELASSSLEDLRDASQSLKARLAAYDGTYSIRDSFQKGKQKLVIELKPLARNMGLTLDEIAGQVRQAYHGVNIQNIQRGESDVSVVIRYPLSERTSLWNLENMHIRLRDGTGVPLLTVADIAYGEGAAQIKRNNRRRVIRVQSKVDEAVTTDAVIMHQLKKDFLNKLPDLYPGMTWSVAGAQKDKAELLGYMEKAYLFALLGMYVMMATLFRSYTQPLMVMFAIPFGIIGAILGHWLLGKDITIWSLVGMIAVSGVVVNDNLVLVDYINRNREKGVALLEAIREAGAARFRPIILTSLTTFAGLLPLMQEQSLQAQFLIPMAISLAFGVMFATLVSLVLVPAAYHVLFDLENGVLKLFTQAKEQAAEQPVSVAKEVDRTFDQTTEDDAEKLQWHVGLDEAYELGYKDGLSGVKDRNSPFDLEVLVASWEAGWDDGQEDFKMGKGSEPVKT
ncbi:MAG: efflux RND transporter permease subunit [Pseudomonadales bacterium]|nr:efflux RND transporter permease subunit [Pseudomonadales bacterium]